jgi:hypothetical protein
VWPPGLVSSVWHQLAVITAAAGRIGRPLSSSLLLTLTSNFEDRTAHEEDVGGVASLAESKPAKQSGVSQARARDEIDDGQTFGVLLSACIAKKISSQALS